MNLIISETYRLFDLEILEKMDAINLSFTHLPKFTNVLDMKIDRVSDYFIAVSNPSAIKLQGQGLSTYAFVKEYEKKHNKDIIKAILSLIDDNSVIFLAHDNDSGGNLMANILYYKLLDSGIDKKRIKRVVGVQKTYRNKVKMLDVYLGDFYPFKLLLSILERQRLESRFIFNAKTLDTNLMAGYRNITALYKIYQIIDNEETVVVPRASKGVALATYLTKGLLNENV